MIDLSFLTEEEQEAIMKVLQRDAELKRAEEERVRHLPEKVKDDVQLKNMSGQWFYEAKSKRHRDKIHGADIIRASMRRKPSTLAELGQNKSNKLKNSWVSNVNKEVFVPPELHGIGEHQEEEQLKSSSSSKVIISMLDKPEERLVKAAISPVKQRRNPFNSTMSGDNFNSGESGNRPASLPLLSKKEILSLSEESQPKPNSHNEETENRKELSVEPTDELQKELPTRPIPKARKLLPKATDPVSQKEDLPKPAKQTERINGPGTPPRGILKRSSSSSSTDSEVRACQMLDGQKKNGLPTATIFEGEAEKNSITEEAEDSTQISLEKLKQVRFSSGTGKRESWQSPQMQHGKETGEFDLLEPGEIKNSRNNAVGSDSFGNKHISAVKPLGTYSSTVQIKTKDGLQADTLASSFSDTSRCHNFLVNETLQTTTVTPKKHETPQKTSSNILPSSNNELSVDEACENKSNKQSSHELKSHNNADEHQLSAKTEECEVSNTSSTSLQQGKPDLVEEQDAKTTFKPGKQSDELMKVANESVSKVLDWFKRSSGTEDRKHVSARSQGREPKEEVGFSPGVAVLPTEHSGSSMDGKTEATEELLFGKATQWDSILPTSLILEDIPLTKERMKPKKVEENENQNDNSLTELDCTRVEEKEHGQEIKQQNKKSNIPQHQEHKLPAQKYESEKAIREKRRMREIRAFWERDKTIPSHGEQKVCINTNASGGALKGIGESDKIKPTAVYLANRFDDQSKNILRNSEVSCADQASRSEHQSSFEFRSGHTSEKPERTLPSNDVHEYTETPKASNLQPRIDATSASPETKDKDVTGTLKGKVAACSKQKPSFQVLSLKEKINGKSKNKVSDPSQFQSLRNFWDTGVKLHSSIDREDVSLPNNTSSVTYERKSKKDKGRDNVSKQELTLQQIQTSEREKTQKIDSVEYELPLRSPTLESLNVGHTKNTDSVQLDRKPALSKPQEKMSLLEQEVKEYTEKSIVSSKHVSLKLLQSPDDKDALKETVVDDWLCLPIEKVENKTMLDASFSKEEVAETVDKVVLPKNELDVFKLGLKKLEKEASEVASNLKKNISNGTNFHLNQCKVFERTVGKSHEISPDDQKEEIGNSMGKVNVPSTDEHENKKSLRKFFGEFEPFYLQHQAADKNDTLEGSLRVQAGLQNSLRETFASHPSEYSSVAMKTSDYTNSISQINYCVQSTCQEETGQLEDVSETIEKSVAPSKVSGLSSALEKLLKEASETPPPKPECADSRVQRAAEVEFKSPNYQHDEELPQEISEVIEKSVAPSKVSGLSTTLEKLLKEVSETPPPKQKCADSTVERTAEMEIKSMTYQHDGELLLEIDETIEKSVAPSKVSDLSSALEKLLKEASETPPPKLKHADSTVWRAASMETRSTTCQHDGEIALEISGTMERSALSKAENGVLDVNLQELLKEVSETPASVLENMDKKMQGKIQTSLSMDASHKREGDHTQDLQGTVGKTTVSHVTKFSEFSCSLEKLLQEASEGCPISEELHKQEQFGDNMVPSQKETLFMAVSLPHNAVSSYCTQKMAIKGGAPEQNIKASVNDLAVSETEASGLPRRHGAINKMVKRNMAPVDFSPLEGETNVIAIKTLKIKEKGRRDESTSLDASENNSEFKAQLKFRRTSTPLKDESKSPEPQGAQLCPVSQQEEGGGSNWGSRFSDENSDCLSGTESSTRSEEELNPVLMALKRSADRKIPSKSLEDIPSATSNKGKISKPKEELALSAEDVSTVPSKPDKLFSNPEKLKGMSKSVPSFLQEKSDDRETDTASESSYSLGRIKKSPSSLTNLSSSSGMASLSSVSGSLMSICSADFGNVDVKGNIQFAIDYVEQLNELHIFICQCKDLAVADVKRQRSDPYVKSYLLPEKYKMGKRKTSVKKKTFNPVYNEILRYKIEKAVLKTQSLNISVWHNDTFGRNSFLGEVELDLGTWDWNDRSNKQINWYPLKPRTMTLDLENRGQMKLALQYVPYPVGGKKTQSTGEVHIWVKECHDLPLLRGNRINSFIKCTILPDTSRKSRQKTRTVSKTTNPVFNHTMVYDGFRPEDLKEACIELTVWDHNKLANHFLGGLRIGLGTGKSYGTTVDWMDSTSDETALWEKMMKSPNTWIEDTLPLRMLLVAKLTK